MTLQPDDPQQAQAWIRGTAPDQVVDFYIPRGNQGEMGPRGPIGPSLTVGLVETNSGPAAPGTIGATGLTGPKGDPGGLVYGTALNQTDLNAVTASGIYRQTAAADATLARNYPMDSTTGILTVKEHIQSTAVLQTYEPVWGSRATRVFYQRQLTSGVWTSWRTFSGSRVDQTAGRAIYTWDDLNGREQLIFGDTGWRTLSSTELPNLNAGSAIIRRIGAVVYLVMNGAQFSVSGDIPGLVGFRSSISLYSPPVDVAALSGAPRRVLVLANAGIRTFDTSAMNFSMSYPTNDSWPTTLPGVANGSIPNA